MTLLISDIHSGSLILIWSIYKLPEVHKGQHHGLLQLLLEHQEDDWEEDSYKNLLDLSKFVMPSPLVKHLDPQNVLARCLNNIPTFPMVTHIDPHGGHHSCRGHSVDINTKLQIYLVFNDVYSYFYWHICIISFVNLFFSIFRILSNSKINLLPKSIKFFVYISLQFYLFLFPMKPSKKQHLQT